MLLSEMRDPLLYFWTKLHQFACWFTGWTQRKQSIAENQFVSHQLRSRKEYTPGR